MADQHSIAASLESRLAWLESQHETLERLRRDYEGGDRLMLCEALRLCAREAVPMPHWLAVAVLHAFDDFTSGRIVALQEALNFEAGYNAPHRRARRERAIQGRTAATWLEVLATPRGTVRAGRRTSPARGALIAEAAKRLRRSVVHTKRAIRHARKLRIA